MTTPTAPLLIVGRGPSTYEFDAWDDYSHIMAVSSGIFALPDGVIPNHFVTLDSANYFNSPINDHAIAWRNDSKARQWPFWADETITKHVPEVASVPGRYKPFPMNAALDALKQLRHPDRAKEALLENFEWIQSHYGHIPNWGDYSNVTGWNVINAFGPNFTESHKPLGLSEMRNSVFMAVQIAALLGYGNLHFVGVFDGEGYEQHREVFGKWHTQATRLGMEWLNVGTNSMLANIIPSTQPMETAI